MATTGRLCRRGMLGGRQAGSGVIQRLSPFGHLFGGGRNEEPAQDFVGTRVVGREKVHGGLVERGKDENKRSDHEGRRNVR